MQAAAKKAAKLSPEEMKRMRQAKDPHFKKGGAAQADASAAEADAAAMPPPASRLPPKRKKGLGYQACCSMAIVIHIRSCMPQKVWRIVQPFLYAGLAVVRLYSGVEKR